MIVIGECIRHTLSLSHSTQYVHVSVSFPMFQKSHSDADTSFSDVAKYPYSALQDKDSMPDGVDRQHIEVGTLDIGQ